MVTSPRRMTLSEFLEWDDGTDTRYELVDGEVLAMTSPSEPHGAIVGMLTQLIGARLRPGCRVIGEAGIVPTTGRDTRFHADFVVTCAPPSTLQYVREPVLIVEVLSPSTEEHDRQVKVPAYRLIPSVREILLVSSTRRYAELSRQEDSRWITHDLIGGGTLRLDSVTEPVPLAIAFEAAGL